MDLWCKNKKIMVFFYFCSSNHSKRHRIMKKSTLLLLLFGLGFIHHATAQERAIIQGYCKDENGKVIENVSVYAHDSLLIAITDEHGSFTYAQAKSGEKLRFAHMVYEPAVYTIKEKDLNGKPLNITMKTKSHELLEVEVMANAPHIAFDNPVMSVLDYVICDDGIYMLAYRRRNDGKVLDANAKEHDTQALIAFNDKVMNDPKVEQVLLPIRDGLMMVRVNSF